MNRLLPRLLYVTLLFPTLGLGCGEPTCESTCDRVFYTCGFDYEEPGTSLEGRVGACVDACRVAIDLPSREAEAVEWMQCVDTFACEGVDDQGVSLRAACPPDDYYVGDLTYDSDDGS